MSDAAHEGGCTCRGLRYRVEAAPIIVHACHCRWCQRETGTAFAHNALFIHSDVTLVAGTPDTITTPSASGRGQRIVRCPTCRVAVWSHYAQSGDLIKFIRVGTLDEPDRLPPDVHIFTSTKQPWVVLPAGARAVAEFYDVKATWSPDALARVGAARAAMQPA
jgi:hypothetical protein